MDDICYSFRDRFEGILGVRDHFHLVQPRQFALMNESSSTFPHQRTANLVLYR